MNDESRANPAPANPTLIKFDGSSIPSATDERLTPRSTPLYVVRWIDPGRRTARLDVEQKHYTRWADAHRFAEKLRADGMCADVFKTGTRWRELPHRGVARTRPAARLGDGA